MDRKALIGLLSGVTLVICTMIGVALVNPPAAEGADAMARPAPHDCALGTRPADTGYGSSSEACARAY